ncbi:tyrosine-type recombinase/integrase [Nonomuraea sp. NPDC051191]|uniref:tyrosine-type recombinase/integrase n=1 Tax=Nonomuraea sp. NPDC051191 TaxID=3364372 RepID=UPI00378BFD7A
MRRDCRIRLHDLRHGAATAMLAAGVDIKIVQETLGHKTPAFTRDTYTRSTPKQWLRQPRRPERWRHAEGRPIQGDNAARSIPAVGAAVPGQTGQAGGRAYPAAL